MKQYTYDEFTNLKFDYSMHMSFLKFAVTHYVQQATGIRMVHRTDRNMRTRWVGKTTHTYLFNGIEFDNVAALYMYYMEDACDCGGVYD